MACSKIYGCCGLSDTSTDEEGILGGSPAKIGKRLRNKPLITIFEEQLSRRKLNGKSIAINFLDKSLTYSQLNDYASYLARNIILKLGNRYEIKNPDGDLVIAFSLPMSEKAVSVVLGIMKTGATYLPLDHGFPEDLLFQIVNAFQPVMLIAENKGKLFTRFNYERFSRVCKLCALEDLLYMDNDSQSPIEFLKTFNDKGSEPLKPDDIINRPLALYYSHGLHKNPVGVRISNQTLLNIIVYHWKHMALEKKDVTTVTVPLSSSISAAQLFIPLFLGCNIHIFHRKDVNDTDLFVETLGYKNITRLTIESHHLHDILESIDSLGRNVTVRCLKSLKTVVCRGAFMQYDIARWFFSIFKHGVVLGNVIGTVETGGEVAYECFENLEDYESKLMKGRPTLGNVLDNVRIYVLDEEMTVVPDGQQGEICVSGDCLAMGYVAGDAYGGCDNFGEFVKNPLDKKAPYERLFRTGEFGRILKTASNGKRRLFLEGREDALIKIRGNVFCTEDVSDSFKDLDNVEDAYVLVLHAGTKLQELIAFIQLKRPVNRNRNDLSVIYDIQLRGKLPEWAIPDDIRIVDKVPEHGFPTKKVKIMCPFCLMHLYHHDTEPFQADWESAVSKLKPGPPEDIDNDATKTLIRAIHKFCSYPILSPATIVANLDMSFYELGGSSLNTMEVVLFLNRKGYDIDIYEFVYASTLNEIIQILRTRRRTSDRVERDLPHGVVRPLMYMSINSGNDYSIKDYNANYRSNSIQILSVSYAENNEFQDYGRIPLEEFQKFFFNNLPLYVESTAKGSVLLAFKDKSELVGIIIAHDFVREEGSKLNKSTFTLNEFADEMRRMCADYLPKQRHHETLEICWLGTNELLTMQENVRLVTFLLASMIERAGERGYTGMFIQTTNQLVRDLCLYTFGFELLDCYPANHFVDGRGVRPYHLANDTVVAGCCYLSIKKYQAELAKVEAS